MVNEIVTLTEKRGGLFYVHTRNQVLSMNGTHLLANHFAAKFVASVTPTGDLCLHRCPFNSSAVLRLSTFYCLATAIFSLCQ